LEPIVAHELRDVLRRVQFGRFRRQGQDGDVVGDRQPGREVPSGLIEEQDGVCAGRDSSGNFLQVQGHRLGGTARQNETGPLALGRTDGTEGRLGSLVARGRGTSSALGPAAGDLVLLTDPGLVGEPNF
jgi:hypothetical protein